MKPSQSVTKTTGVFDSQTRQKREAAPKIARALMLLIASFLVFAIIWSTKTEMRELVRAEGEIAPLGELRRVDHFDGGVVVDLFVTVGTLVVANQPLAKIENPGLRSQIAELEAELASLDNEISSLTWLLEGEVVGDVSPSIEAQRNLFTTRQEMMKRRTNRLAEAVEIAAAMRDNARDHLSISETSLSRLQKLHDRGVVSQSKLLVQAEEAASIRADYFRADANYSKAKLDASEASAASDEAYLSFQEEHLITLSNLTRSRKLNQIKLNGLIAKKSRQMILAPESGVIQSSFTTTIGEVVPPGATLFELLPSGKRLIAVVKIDPKDVGHVRVGAKVVMKVTTFDVRRYGEVHGSIELISPTSIVPDNAPAFYKAQLSLESDTVGDGLKVGRLRAGMTLSAEIETSKRSVLSYLLKPVQSVLSRSLSER